MHDIQTTFGAPGYLILAGSRLYGIDVATSDYDYTGAVVEPVEYRIGLQRFRDGGDPQHGFEQYQFHGAEVGARGDSEFEGTIYSLWKLASMFAEGNPTVLCLLYGTPITDTYGINTPEFREMVASARSGRRFMKYMQAQRKSMIGQRAKHVQRLELIEAHGFDTKFAGHMIRLCYQGCEFLDTGHVTLPMPESERQAVLGIRQGKWSVDDVISLSEALEAEMDKALARTHLRPEADYEALDAWLVERYLRAYTPKISRRIPSRPLDRSAR